MMVLDGCSLENRVQEYCDTYTIIAKISRTQILKVSSI